MNLDPAALSFVAGAATVGLVHTLAGPDHYLPFIAMAKSAGWSRRRALIVTLLCGLGHVSSSLVLAGLGALLCRSFERAATSVDSFAALRAQIATWLLIVGGTLYAAWGLKRAFRRHAHAHVHAHADGTIHAHGHQHGGVHLHPHPARTGADARRRLTPWVLFTIFVFGPCEPLLPFLLAPEVAGRRGLALIVVLVFTAATLLAMTTVVMLALRSADLVPRRLSARLERFQHAIAGAMVAACGVAMAWGM